jgi:hypothetical protein
MGVILAQDDFEEPYDEPNGTLLRNHTPDVGSAWTPLNMVDQEDNFEIHSRSVAYVVPSGSPVDSNIWQIGMSSMADGYVTMKHFSYTPLFAGLMGRIQSGAFYWIELVPYTTDYFLFIDWSTSEAYIIPATWSFGLQSRMEFSGTTVRAYLDGILMGTLTSSLGAGGTGFIMRSGWSF